MSDSESDAFRHKHPGRKINPQRSKAIDIANTRVVGEQVFLKWLAENNGVIPQTELPDYNNPGSVNMYDGTKDVFDLITTLSNFTQASRGMKGEEKERLKASIPKRVANAQDTMKALREMEGIHLSHLEMTGKQLYKNAQEEEKERPEYAEEIRQSNDAKLATHGNAIKTSRETIAALVSIEAKFKELQEIVNKQREL